MAQLILLVEDNPDDVLLIKTTLEFAGLSNPIKVVSDAEAAMLYLIGAAEYADRSEHPLPNVILLDLHLPGKSGHDLLKWMSQQKTLNPVVRVVLTGSDNPADLKKSYELGANAYLQKPLTVEQLTGPARNLLTLLAGGRTLAAAPG